MASVPTEKKRTTEEGPPPNKLQNSEATVAEVKHQKGGIQKQTELDNEGGGGRRLQKIKGSPSFLC